MKVAIYVDHSNCYLLDGVIKQYDLQWKYYRPTNPTLRSIKDRVVMNNYLVICLETKILEWIGRNIFFSEVSSLELIGILQAEQRPDLGEK